MAFRFRSVPREQWRLSLLFIIQPSRFLSLTIRRRASASRIIDWSIACSVGELTRGYLQERSTCNSHIGSKGWANSIVVWNRILLCHSEPSEVKGKQQLADPFHSVEDWNDRVALTWCS